MDTVKIQKCMELQMYPIELNIFSLYVPHDVSMDQSELGIMV